MLNNGNVMKNNWIWFLAAVTLSPWFTARACNVPVFRYGLERWPADPYEVIVFHNGALSPEEREVVDWLNEPSGPNVRFANYLVREADLSSEVPEVLRELYDRLETKTLPCIALRYPGMSSYRLAIWSGPLKMETAKTIIDSPARQAIAGRIVDGESAVWILIESGNSAKDDKAARLLGENIGALETSLRLPAEIQGNEAFMPVDLSTGPEVRIDFSLFRLSRDDPAEAIFIDMFMHTEPDLFDYSGEPMAFPVYARGRALYALIGEGINEMNVRAACEFLTGACSCEVKALNPGVDLLMAVDWEAELGETWIQAEDLPPLVGITEMAPVSDGEEDDEPAVQTVSEVRYKAEIPVDNGSGMMSGALLRNMLITLGAVVLVVSILAVVTVRRGRGNKQ